MNAPDSHLELAQELRRLLLPHLPSRPFIAQGSPLTSDVAIVGINPGTSTPFWEFWSEQSGFDRERWINVYYSKPGSKRNATRNRIERFVAALRPLKVIELNAYPYVTRTEAEITEEMKDARVLKLMLRVSKPRALFLFGKKPIQVLASLLGIDAPAFGTITRYTHEGSPLLVFAESHLSRGWSYAAVEELASRVKDALQNAA